MKILFELGHPAHIHLFKNFIKYLNGKHKTLVLTRKKDILDILAKHYEINFLSISISQSSFLFKFIELIIRDFKVLWLHLRERFDVSFGSSESIAHVSFVSGLLSIHFDEDDDEVVKLSTMIGYPFFNIIINPDCLKFSKWKNKRILHNSYHELAYLHPNNFIPDESILKKYDLEKKKYVIIRLNSLKAHHDIGAKGISIEIYSKIKKSLTGYTIIESKENSKTHTIEPWDMHHVLAFAKMIICDSQTMAAEAMVLGVPSIRINSFIGKLSYLDELENKYRLGFGILPLIENEEKIIRIIESLIMNTDVEKAWQEKRQIMLSEKCDLNQWMIDYFEREINLSN